LEIKNVRLPSSSKILWLPELDGLRAMAAIVVACAHFVPVNSLGGRESPYFFNFLHVVAAPNIAVIFFFGLSSFLLAYLWETSRIQGKNYRWHDFYIKRILRIWPLYLLVLAVSIALFLQNVYDWKEIWAPQDKVDWTIDNLWRFFTFTYNWSLAYTNIGGYVDNAPNNLRLMWSISVEEQFYIVFPIIMILMSQRNCLAFVVFLMVVIGVWFRSSFIGETGYMYYATLTYLDTFAFGTLAGILVGRINMDRWRPPSWFLSRITGFTLVITLIAVGWVMTGYMWPPYGGSELMARLIAIGGYTILAIAVAASIMWIVLSPQSLPSRCLRSPIARQLGLLSFGIYLWHPTAQIISREYETLITIGVHHEGCQFWFTIIATLLYFAIIVTLSSLSYILVERPFLNLRPRFGGSSSALPILTPQRVGPNPMSMLIGGGTSLIVLLIVMTASNNIVKCPAQLPITPNLLNINRSSDGSMVTFNWARAEHTVTYQVEMQTNKDNFVPIANLEKWRLTHIVNDLVPTSEYCFRVRACNPIGCSPYSQAMEHDGISSAACYPAKLPITPNLLNINRSSDGSMVTFNWARAEHAITYQVEMQTNKDNFVPIANLEKWRLTHIVNDLAPTGEYCFRVRACNPIGCSPYSQAMEHDGISSAACPANESNK
jgi:peptidoglycan/LPS O-acetylase OafA/YrhL